MIDIYTIQDKQKISDILYRAPINHTEVSEAVKEVFEAVRQNSDQAVREYTKKFDHYQGNELLVSKQEISNACPKLSKEVKDAIHIACGNIMKFHSAYKEVPQEIETTQGISCSRRSVGIEKVGLYVPSGTAALFSTVLMLAVPARIAGCREVILCSPPDANGEIAPEILYAAHYTGVDKIYKVGGIQAIAAMTFGTETIPSVYKIFGPGNSYVTSAKLYAQNFGVAIDMPAGPSEVMVVADSQAKANVIAADLLAQLEHGSDSQAILITQSSEQAIQVIECVHSQMKNLPRAEILLKSIYNLHIFISPSIQTSIDWINAYAPEHLILSVADTSTYEAEVVNAGSVFLGYNTPESLGDYASGTNHTLPTSAWARSYSGVSVDSFVRKITYQRASAQGLANISGTVQTMARAEGLEAHRAAVSIRMESLTQNTEQSRSIVRENIKNLSPYSSARDEFTGDAKVMLDANESPYDVLLRSLNRYPDPHHKALKESISTIKSIPPSKITLCNGSDECIDILLRSICTPAIDNIICTSPSYGMYSVSAAINDIKVRKVSLDPNDFSLDTDKMLSAVDLCSKAIFICSPNNPTGNIIPLNQIEHLAENFKGLVVVDEAYIDFTKSPSAYTIIDKYPNLVIIQTLSKAWGVAGLRIGILIASKELSEIFSKVKPPYNISHAAQQAALEQLSSSKQILSDIENIINQRETLSQRLLKLQIVERVYPSQANFLLVKFSDADSVYQHLVSQGIVVRSRSKEQLCANCLRISIGTQQENDTLYHTLADYKK